MIVLVSVGIYSMFQVQDVFTSGTQPDYYKHVYPWLQECSPLEIPEHRGPFKWWYICASYNWLGHENIIPFVFAIGLLPLTYLLGFKMSGYRLAGLIAMYFVMFSNNFTRYDTSATYDQSAAFFLILSVLMLYYTKSFHASKWFYWVGLLSKSLAVLYIPMYIYTMKKIGIKRWKHHSVLLMIPIVVFGVYLLIMFGSVETIGAEIRFNPQLMIDRMDEWPRFFVFDLMWWIFALGTYKTMLGKRKIPGIEVPMIWTVGIIISIPLIMTFTSQLVYAFRLVPLTIFFAIQVGMILNQFYVAISERRQIKKNQ